METFESVSIAAGLFFVRAQLITSFVHAVAKPRIWMFAGGFRRVMSMILLFVGLLVCQAGDSVNAQGPDDGTLYLNQKELHVMEIARNATLNNEACGNLDGCSAACSRVTCYPLSGGTESPQCPTVENSSAVDNSEIYDICLSGPCQTKVLLDYNRSFVRLPAPAYTSLSTEVARDICLQRLLDSTFKTVSVQSESVQSERRNGYFGSTSGAFRAFPGQELNETQCTSYDPRIRPWYLNGISVSRDVKILVDVANSMGNLVKLEYSTRPPGTTYLDVAKSITLGLLHSLSAQDYVEVFSFDNVTATSLGVPVRVNSSYDYSDPFGQTELAALVADVNALAESSVTAGSSDLNGAVRKAASSFNELHSLKVIVVLSNGLFVVNSTTFPSVDLQNKQAKLMVYKLPTNDDGGDTFLQKTSFQKDICSVNGSFESLDALATANPLYSMRSYFTYLAQTQLSAVGNNVTWSNKHESFSHKQNVITPTYPAFGSDGLLIGVAGIDVVIDKIEEPLKSLVLQAFKNRNGGTLPAPSSISMTCSYQNASAKSFCPGSTMPNSSAICLRKDTSSTLADRTSCCGSCGSGEVTKKSSLKAWIIALIAIAVIVLVAVAGAVVYYCMKPNEPVIPVWQG